MADGVDLDKYLRLESQQFSQEEEVTRLLTLIKQKNKDPLLTLDMPTDCYVTLQVDLKLVKKQFRAKSLLVHPDKNSHVDARSVFDYLQEAVAEINDQDKFRIIKNYIKEARDNIFYIQGLKKARAHMGEGEVREKIDHQKLLDENPKLGRLVQLEFIRLAQELAYRDRTRLKNELGRDLEMSEKIEADNKRKAQYENDWEDTRQDRIKSWHKFADKTKKKKRKSSPPPGQIRR